MHDGKDAFYKKPYELLKRYENGERRLGSQWKGMGIRYNKGSVVEFLILFSLFIIVSA